MNPSSSSESEGFLILRMEYAMAMATVYTGVYACERAKLESFDASKVACQAVQDFKKVISNPYQTG